MRVVTRCAVYQSECNRLKIEVNGSNIHVHSFLCHTTQVCLLPHSALECVCVGGELGGVCGVFVLSLIHI